MSMYYNYYLGYLDEENKIVPLGPFDNEGNLKCLFFYNYHSDIKVHNECINMSVEQVSDEFKKHFFLNLDKERGETVESKYSSYNFAYQDLKTFINGITSPQCLVKSGYWKIEEMSSFLNQSADEQQEALYFGDITDPIKPEVYAAKVLADPEEAKEYMFYAICDIYNNDDYYRYLAYEQTKEFIEDWKHQGRKYVIFYEFS